MFFDVPILFAGLGSIILLGFLANYFFLKTRIPDVIWLVLLGILLGPLSHLIDQKLVMSYAPFFAALATVIILFEGGINTDLLLLVKEFKNSVLIAVGNVILSMIFCGIVMNKMFSWPLMYGMLLGVMIGGTSSPVIISMTKNLKIDEKTRTILNVESTLTDVLCFVLSMALISVILEENTSLELVLNKIMSNFSVGAVIGFISGIFWLSIIKKVKGKFKYMITLGFTFLVYSFVEKIMASGAIAVLTMGIVLGNSYEILKMLEAEKAFLIDRKIKEFHEEITFLIKSFFFVYLGTIINLSNIFFVLLGFFLTLLLLTLRYIFSSIVLLKLNIPNYDKQITKVLMGRGLAAAVLSQFPLFYNLEYAEWFPNTILLVIIFSILFSSLGIMMAERSRKKEKLES